MILVGDIGATTTPLGLFRCEAGRPLPVSVNKFHNRGYSCLDAVLDAFLTDYHKISAICFGAAGPVIDGKIAITNLPWMVESAVLDSRFPNAAVSLMNDVEATGYGIGTLGPGDLLVLNAGCPDPSAPAALIASGTGLGEAVLYCQSMGRVPYPSEAGHADFAPSNDLQAELLLPGPEVWPRELGSRALRPRPRFDL
jgi:glucokinase